MLNGREISLLDFLSGHWDFLDDAQMIMPFDGVQIHVSAEEIELDSERDDEQTSAVDSGHRPREAQHFDLLPQLDLVLWLGLETGE